MNLTSKEQTLLTDLSGQEKLCIKKYEKYAESAADPALRTLFSDIRTTEEGHLNTINTLLSGGTVSAKAAPMATGETFTGPRSTVAESEKQNDAYLCRDALAGEKHVSSLYDVSIFEFTEPALRDTLAHIQKEEQNHGQKLYEYLNLNGLYGN